MIMFRITIVQLVLSTLCLALFDQDQISFSKQVTLNNVSYYVPPLPMKKYFICKDDILVGDLGESLLFPMSVIYGNDSFSVTDYSRTTEYFGSFDDVYNDAFSSTVMTNSTNVITDSFKNLSQVSSIVTNLLDIPQGPYFASYLNGVLSLFEPYRLYADNFQTFQLGIVADQINGGYMPLPAAVDTAHAQTVAVPSRLIRIPNKDKPLNGYRVAVKDLYDVEGIKTSGSSRPYWELYGAAENNSFPIQRLVDLGAVIIGKLKLTQFANGENPTADYVDYHAPFNPRGDGYQSPSSSSCGSGAAEAAYSWIDVTLGSDTGCSVRCPANSQGLFGVRPTFDAISLDGVISMSSVMDTAGFFARDAEKFNFFGKYWYGESDILVSNYTVYPDNIITFKQLANVSDFMENSASDEVLEIYNDFLNQTMEYLNASHEELDIYKSIKNSTGRIVDDLFNQTWSILAGYDQYVNVWEPFKADYQDKFDGDVPFLDPVPKFRWDYSYFNATEVGYNEALNKKQIIDEWFNDVILRDNESCSSSIYIYLSNIGSTSYRNSYFPSPSERGLSSYSTLYISSFARTPEVVVPLGEVPYNSTITLTEKYLPVTATIGAAPGCDFMLYDLVAELQSVGIIHPVNAGSRLY